MKNYEREILIADDEISICQSLREVISTHFGYKVDIAEDGLVALEKIKQDNKKFGIILTDLKMPNMNGLELIREARKINNDLVFIIITGYATKDNAISALKEGAYDFVHKPFNIDEMRAVLNRAVNHWLLKEDNKNYQMNLENLVEQRTSEIKTLNNDLNALLNLEDSINKTKEFERRIDSFHNEFIRRFSPQTILFILYDNFSKAFSSPWIFSSENASIQFPETDDVLKNGKRHFCADIMKAGLEKSTHLNKEDKAFFFSRLEHEVFLGYLYIGFPERPDILQFENPINLFTTSLESILYNNYLVKKHERELEKMFLSGIKVISDTVEANSPFTRKHSDRVEKVAKLLSEKMGFGYERKYKLSVACILHDIGKVGIDSRIVYKPGRLDEEELKQIQLHPVLGANIVKDLYGISIDKIIRHHHERWDGAGYPDNLQGEQIPLESRIISLADAFDSMIANRPYRKGLPLPAVKKEIEENAGTQFDPYLSRLFLECIEENLSTFKLMILTENE
jgi:response regulator RpfG family c-di-GMP phosphodiesterase